MGYLGLFLGAFLAATVIPFSSDAMLVGLIAVGGDPYICVAVATVGNTLGGMSSYGLGYIGRWEWIERWMRVKPETLERQKDRIAKYGSLLAFMTWLPVVGDLFALALGFYKIDWKKSLIFMFIGKGVRYVAWALIFYCVKPYF